MAVGVLLAFTFYKPIEDTGSVKKAPEVVEQNPSLLPNTTNDLNKKTITPISLTTLDEKLTIDEKALLYFSKQNPTKEDEKARYVLIDKLAVESNKIVVNNCLVKPVVLKTKNGSTVTVVNEGTNDFSLSAGGMAKLSVPAGSSVDFKVSFEKPEGLFAFGCDGVNLSRAIGLILVSI